MLTRIASVGRSRFLPLIVRSYARDGCSRLLLCRLCPSANTYLSAELVVKNVLVAADAQQICPLCILHSTCTCTCTATKCARADGSDVALEFVS